MLPGKPTQVTLALTCHTNGPRQIRHLAQSIAATAPQAPRRSCHDSARDNHAGVALCEASAVLEGLPRLRDDGLLTHGQAAYVLGMSKQALTTWVRQGRLAPVGVTAGGHRRYRAEDVHALLPRDAR